MEVDLQSEYDSKKIVLFSKFSQIWSQSNLEQVLNNWNCDKEGWISTLKNSIYLPWTTCFNVLLFKCRDNISCFFSFQSCLFPSCGIQSHMGCNLLGKDGEMCFSWETELIGPAHNREANSTGFVGQSATHPEITCPKKKNEARGRKMSGPVNSVWSSKTIAVLSWKTNKTFCLDKSFILVWHQDELTDLPPEQLAV